LFKSQYKNIEDTEIVILLTPHIAVGDKNVLDEKKEILPDRDDGPGDSVDNKDAEVSPQGAETAKPLMDVNDKPKGTARHHE